MKKTDTNKIITLNGTALQYVLEHRRVKHARLEFKGKELHVVLPRGISDDTSLIETKIGWITKKQSQIQRAIESVGATMKNENDFLIFGEFFQMREGGSLLVDFDGKSIRCDFSNPEHVKRLFRILKKELAVKISNLSREYAEKFGVRFNRISIKNQRSKWASCSSNKTLSFNIQLVHLPEELVRYVVCHEVIHLIVSGHKKDFWNLVKQEFANYKEMERKLFEYWYFLQENGKILNPPPRRAS